MEGFFFLYTNECGLQTNLTPEKQSPADILFQKLFSIKKTAQNQRNRRNLPKPTKSAKTDEICQIRTKPQNLTQPDLSQTSARPQPGPQIRTRPSPSQDPARIPENHENRQFFRKISSPEEKSQDRCKTALSLDLGSPGSEAS